MEQIPWYVEASLAGPGRVYCADNLAQCVRRWIRLTDAEKQTAQIRLWKPIDGQTQYDKGRIAALAASPDLKRV
jgi:hypothetical protein